MALPSKNNDAMLIFDWDDTILPSSFVDKAQADNTTELPQQYHGLFREIEICAEKCLSAAAKHGEVIIITNSDEGWVKYSAERWLPNLLPVLDKYRVISARTRYERFYPHQPLCWKAAAFAHEVNEHFCSLEEAHELLNRECGAAAEGGAYDALPDLDLASADDSSMGDGSLSSAEADSPGVGSCGPCPALVTSAPASYRREIISFGDSIEERTAVKIVSDQLDALPKSVKFLRDPTPTQIIGQLTMLTHHMQYVCEHAEGLDLEISQKQADMCAQGHLARNGLNGEGAKAESPSILQRILGKTPSPQELSSDDTEMAHYDC